MAFIKLVIFKGYNARYFNITSIQDNKNSNQTFVTLSMYKDKVTRSADPSATLAVYTYTLPGVDMKRQEIYPLIKTMVPDGYDPKETPIMADATDDLD
jgi:hypothetical protein